MRKLLPLLFVLFAIGCSKKKDEPEPTQISHPTIDLHYDQTHQYILKSGSEEIFASTFKWSSSDTLVGKADANGKFTARKIGETTIKATSGSSTVESKVTVTPYVTEIIHPLLDFGATKAQIKAKEKREYLTEEENYLAYKGSPGSLTNIVLYVFEQGKLDVAGLDFTVASGLGDRIGKFYAERYPYRALIDGDYILLNDDKKYGILIRINSQGVAAIYAANNTGARISGKSKDVSAILSEIRKKVK